MNVSFISSKKSVVQYTQKYWRKKSHVFPNPYAPSVLMARTENAKRRWLQKKKLWQTSYKVTQYYSKLSNSLQLGQISFQTFDGQDWECKGEMTTKNRNFAKHITTLLNIRKNFQIHSSQAKFLSKILMARTENAKRRWLQKRSFGKHFTRLLNVGQNFLHFTHM